MLCQCHVLTGLDVEIRMGMCTVEVLFSHLMRESNENPTMFSHLIRGPQVYDEMDTIGTPMKMPKQRNQNIDSLSRKQRAQNHQNRVPCSPQTRRKQNISPLFPNPHHFTLLNLLQGLCSSPLQKKHQCFSSRICKTFQVSLWPCQLPL